MNPGGSFGNAESPTGGEAMNSDQNRKDEKLPRILWLFLTFVIFFLSAAVICMSVPKSWAAQVMMEVYQ